MKILIVDDEKITRNGLISSIAWKALGIEEIFQADDGLHGLELAKKMQPDIVLSDVRMPRMDGIQMAEAIQEVYPYCSIIFMSGYSDKEYLKAAIKLKAVSYVEKPIEIEEVTEAIEDAARIQQQNLLTLHTKKLSLSSKIATELLHKKSKKEWLKLSSEPDFTVPTDNHVMFFTLIYHLQSPSLPPLPEEERLQIRDEIRRVLDTYSLHEVHVFKMENIAIYHIWGLKEYGSSTFQRVLSELAQAGKNSSLPFYLIAGKPVYGIENIYESYNTAVILLQRSFFYPIGSLLVYKEDIHSSFLPLDSLFQECETDFTEALYQKDVSALTAISESLLEKLSSSDNYLPNHIKDLYFKLLTNIRNAYQHFKLDSSDSYEPKESIWDNISRCNSIYELHTLLLHKLEVFSSSSKTSAAENTTIYLIKDFISKHYQQESLSVKDISQHVHLSSSYVCTLFKTETNQTLNQYITEYRIEKAKQLLTDPRYKITEISSRIGYNDGNYFSKTFKKITGCSPSEYRELEMKGKGNT